MLLTLSDPTFADKPIISLRIEKANIGGNPFASVICHIESFPLPDEAKIIVAGDLGLVL